MGDGITEQERRLHILTVNIRGLKTNDEKLLNKLKKPENSEVDVVFLTETKIGENTTDTNALKKYEDDWIPFFTRYNSQSQGAAILVNKKRDFSYLHKIVDGRGRYVIVNCWISGILCTFVSVYHHEKATGLLKELSEKIKPLYTDMLVVGGDFNVARNIDIDRTHGSGHSYHYRIREELQSFMDKNKLVDAWREKHPKDREYTYKYRHNRVTCYSRLDYFFVNTDKSELVHDCRINRDDISDHRSVSLILDLKTRKPEILSCTVHNLLRDQDKLHPDIILLTKGKAGEEYVQKLKEEEGKTKWNVLWSRHSNAAILVAKGQRDIHILFTVYHEHYVILHCIALGMRHTFVSACHPIEKNLPDMLREIMPSYSGRKVIGGNFNISEQTILELKKYDFYKSEGGSTQFSYLIHAQLGRAYEIKEQKILGHLYHSLILHLPKIEPKDVDNIIRSLDQLKIHH